MSLTAQARASAVLKEHSMDPYRKFVAEVTASVIISLVESGVYAEITETTTPEEAAVIALQFALRGTK